MRDEQYMYSYLGRWYFANTVKYGQNAHFNDAHGIKFGTVESMSSAKLIGLEVKYGNSKGIIKDILSTTKTSEINEYSKFSKNKTKSRKITEIGVFWTKRDKNDNLYYWMDINELEVLNIKS